MSIHVMNHVWRSSRQELGALLVMLALADFSNDDGVSWPAIAVLAKKSRLSERQVYNVLERLKAEGELAVEHKGGPKQSNIYRIRMADGPANCAPANFAPETDRPVEVQSEVKSTGGRGVIENRHIEPSEEEPSGERAAAAAASSPDGSVILRALERNYAAAFRDVTPIILETLAKFAAENPGLTPADVKVAFQESAVNGGRSWRYVEAILRRLASDKTSAVPLNRYAHQCGPMCKNGCVMVKEAASA